MNDDDSDAVGWRRVVVRTWDVPEGVPVKFDDLRMAIIPMPSSGDELLFGLYMYRKSTGEVLKVLERLDTIV